jgi:hypothetical protein
MGWCVEKKIWDVEIRFERDILEGKEEEILHRGGYSPSSHPFRSAYGER